MRVQEKKPENHARVIVNIAGWTDRWYRATAHVKDGLVRWRFDHAGWLDAHPTDEWKHEE